MKRINCNICDSVRYTPLFRGKDRLHHTDEKLFDYVRCVECGLVFMNPQLEPYELKKYYPVRYGPYQDDNEIFKRGMISKSIEKVYRTLFSKENNHKIILDNTKFNYLDFGCGSGATLERVKKKHPLWNLYGLDNNKYACTAAREKGFKIFYGDILEINIPQNFFDIVNMSHVIEHLNDPKKTLLKINSLMKPGGQIIISTPNFDSLAARIFKTYWFALDAPRHLFIFAPDNLKRLLKDTGFVVEKLESDGNPKIGIKSLYYLLGKKDLRINPFIWRLFRPLSLFLAKFHKTSIMTVYARRY